jgi:DNA repair protein RAD57
LYVQVPVSHGGLSAAACYLTTSSTLPTTRLLQIAEASGLLSLGCSLENVHTISVPTVPVLQRVLADTLPNFIEQTSVDKPKPVKLLVIDALGELFHSNNKTTTSTLVERSRDVARLAANLHDLASKYRLAVLVLNEVIDVFRRSSNTHVPQGDMLYDQQSRWFNTAEFFGDGSKEAVLGLTWANQINTRIMLSRTGRRKYLTADDTSKRRHLSNPDPPPQAKEGGQMEPSLIRRLSVLFSNVTSPITLDYIVTECGVSVVQGDIVETSHVQSRQATADNPVAASNSSESVAEKSAALVDGDEFDQLWEQEEYRDLDWDALELSLSQNAL